MQNTPSDLGWDRRIFLLLVGFRWASLFPAVWLLLRPGEGDLTSSALPTLPALVAAALSCLLITIFSHQLNRWLMSNPMLLLFDIVFSSGLLVISGGTQSPYFLFSLSPLLAGAFFFQTRGALISSAVFTLIYLISIAAFPKITGAPTDTNLLFTQLAGIWLIPVLFSYPSLLLSRINETRQALAATKDDLAQQNADLARANRQLEIIHDLTILLQAAPDLNTVQQRVLRAVTEELGYTQALVGVMNPDTQTLGEWQAYFLEGDNRFAESGRAPNPMATSAILQAPAPIYLTSRELGLESASSQWLGMELDLREHPVGILLVALNGTQGELSSQQHDMLQVVASQAAIALGTTMVCIDRTRRLAVEQERNRIARDIHDTIAQSLFGMVFSLDACIAMLPKQVDAVRLELEDLRSLASRVRDEIRQSIFDLWPGELTLEQYKSDLCAYVAQCCHPHSFQINFTTNGDFERVSPIIRRTLFRLTQEALINAARHSGARSAQVCLGVEADQVHLSIRDEGVGFDLKGLNSSRHSQGGFGLPGITARVNALGGESVVLSQKNQGTLILASLPLISEDSGES